eukprot:gene18606-25120_t
MFARPKSGTSASILRPPRSHGRLEALNRSIAGKTPDMETRSKRAREVSNETIEAVRERFSSADLVLQHVQVSKKEAAVLVPLFQGDDGVVRVILTQRSAKMKSHSGEVCLPGGKRDPEDISTSHTALREANEELGLQSEDVQVLCNLAPVLSKHYLSVTPVVAQISSSFDPIPNPDEVAAVFDMPLAAFLEDSASHTSRDVEWQGFPYRIHSFKYKGFDVWGLTAGIMIQVAKIGLGRCPAFEELSPDALKNEDGTAVTSQQLYYDGENIKKRNLGGKKDGDDFEDPVQQHLNK